MALRPRLSPGVQRSFKRPTVGLGTGAVKSGKPAHPSLFGWQEGTDWLRTPMAVGNLGMPDSARAGFLPESRILTIIAARVNP